jgi:hypothetical protein
MSYERHLTVSEAGLDGMDAALAWAVQAADREFGSRPSRVELCASYALTDDDGTEERWTAAVSGLVPAPEAAP